MPEIPDVRAAMLDVSRLQQELTDALEDGRPDDVDRILAELTVAERRRNRLLQRASNSSPSGFDAAPPIREQENREQLWRALFEAAQAHLRECPRDGLFELPVIQPELLRAESDVFEDGRAEELVIGILKQQSDVPADADEQSCGADQSHAPP